MENQNGVSNENIMSMDFSAAERQASIRSIPNMKSTKDVELAPGLSARGVFGRDVSAMDSRSVKAQLAGRGDYRAAWWNFCCALHQRFAKDKTLERAMYKGV